MRKIPYRVSLPVIFGIIAVALMVWDHKAMYACMGYDAGSPFWPCETPRFVLNTLNLPTLLLSTPLVRAIGALSGDYDYKFEYVVKLPIILLWWWFVGTRADFGLLGKNEYKRRKAWIYGLGALAFILWCLFIWITIDSFLSQRRYIETYGFGTYGMRSVLSSVFGLPWFALLVGATSVATYRVIHLPARHTGIRLGSSRSARVVLLLLTLYGITAAMLIRHWHGIARQREEAEYRAGIIIKGRIVDENGHPVEGITVDLVPLGEAEKALPWSVPNETTDENGEYLIRPKTPGDYFLAVMWKQSPSAYFPYLTRFYPNASEQKSAEILTIPPALHRTMPPITLQHIALVHLPMEVFWSNGAPEPYSFVIAANSLFPNEPGLESRPLAADKDGTFSIPSGFDYRATALVRCGKKDYADTEIKSSAVSFTTKSGTAPPTAPLRLVLPGEPCTIWHPK